MLRRMVSNLGLRRGRPLSAMMQLSMPITLHLSSSTHTHNTQPRIMSLKRVSTLAARAAIALLRPTRFQASGLLRPTAKLQSTVQRPASCLVQQRFHSTEGKPDNKVWNFDSVKQLTESPDPTRVLIGTCSPLLPCSSAFAPLTLLSLSAQMSANPPNTPPATSPPPSTSPSALRPTHSSCPPTNSRISLVLRSPLQIKSWCFIAKLELGVLQRLGWLGRWVTAKWESIGVVGWSGVRMVERPSMIELRYTKNLEARAYSCVCGCLHTYLSI